MVTMVLATATRGEADTRPVEVARKKIGSANFSDKRYQPQLCGCQSCHRGIGARLRCGSGSASRAIWRQWQWAGSRFGFVSQPGRIDIIVG